MFSWHSNVPAFTVRFLTATWVYFLLHQEGNVFFTVFCFTVFVLLFYSFTEIPIVYAKIVELVTILTWESFNKFTKYPQCES